MRRSDIGYVRPFMPRLTIADPALMLSPAYRTTGTIAERIVRANVKQPLIIRDLLWR
jgi:hypothetical protein